MSKLCFEVNEELLHTMICTSTYRDRFRGACRSAKIRLLLGFGNESACIPSELEVDNLVVLETGSDITLHPSFMNIFSPNQNFSPVHHALDVQFC